MSNNKNSNNIHEIIDQGLNAAGYHMVDLVSIPARGDRMVRIQTLEDALQDFDSSDTVSYLVHVRAHSAQANEPSLNVTGFQGTSIGAIDPSADNDVVPAMVSETLAPPTVEESVYLPNGKMNIGFLMRNAQLLFEARDYVLARNIYGTVLKSGEKSGLAHLWLARCFEAEGNIEATEKHLSDSLAYQPSLDAYQRLAAIHIRKKKDQSAAELMERALAMKTLSPSVRFELHKACGNCWLRSDKMKEAEAHYRKALENQPSSDTVLANLGALCLQMGRIDEAARSFQTALGTNARNEKALSGLGSCALAKNDKRAAHDFFAKALDIELNNPSAIYHLVKCAYELKTYATAARVVADYVQIAPVNTNLLYSLSGLQFHLGRMNDARTTATRVLELNAQHTGALELIKMIENFGNA